MLLCENAEGYRNLIKLVSAGFLEGFYYKPRIDYDLLAKHSRGLIALSACLSGAVAEPLLEQRYDDARDGGPPPAGYFRQGQFLPRSAGPGPGRRSARSIATWCGSRARAASRWWPPTIATT